MSKTVIVVGPESSLASDYQDCFVTVNQLAKWDLSEVQLISGQGLSESERTLVELLSLHQSTVGPQAASPPVPSCHKARLANRLIRAPRTIGNIDEYELAIDEQNEFLLDHRTGCHVPAMISIEAGRQATINAFDLRHADVAGQVRHSWTMFEFDDPEYYFFLPTKVRLWYEALRSAPARQRWTYCTLVEFIQAGRTAFVCTYEMEVYNLEKLNRVEDRAQAETISNLKRAL